MLLEINPADRTYLLGLFGLVQMRPRVVRHAIVPLCISRQWLPTYLAKPQWPSAVSA